MCFDFIEKGCPLDLHNKHLLEKYKIQGMLDVMNESESGRDAERSVQKLIKKNARQLPVFLKSPDFPIPDDYFMPLWPPYVFFFMIFMNSTITEESKAMAI